MPCLRRCFVLKGSAGDVYLEHFPDPDALMKAVGARLAYPVDASLPDPGRLITQAITAFETDWQKRRRELAATLPVFGQPGTEQ